MAKVRGTNSSNSITQVPPKKQALSRTGRTKTAGEAVTKRTEQQRKIESRNSILRAALSEFAEKGFEAASIRSIGERVGLHFTLITYHFGTKQQLWEETIRHFFTQISETWRAEMLEAPTEDAFDVLRHQFNSFLKFSVLYPDFHKAILRENRIDGPRIDWVMRYFVTPIMDATMPNIVKAQKSGDIPKCDKLLFYYLAIGACTALSSSGAEIKCSSGLDSQSPAIVSEYWSIVDQMIFKAA